MKAAIRTARAFLVDIEPGDVIKVRSRYVCVHSVVALPEGNNQIRIYAADGDGRLPVAEGPWYLPVTVYQRKEQT